MKKKLVTERFTNRVENYLKYRPDYPETAIAAIIRICKLTNNSVVADIGAGTGKFTRSLLQHEMQVFAVEPNQTMRQSAEELLTKFTGFHSQPGTAEHTGLAGCSVDLVVAAQAFHWFSSVRTLEEFSRILKPDGWLGLIWNRRTMTEPFHRVRIKIFTWKLRI